MSKQKPLKFGVQTEKVTLIESTPFGRAYRILNSDGDVYEVIPKSERSIFVGKVKENKKMLADRGKGTRIVTSYAHGYLIVPNMFKRKFSMGDIDTVVHCVVRFSELKSRDFYNFYEYKSGYSDKKGRYPKVREDEIFRRMV